MRDLRTFSIVIVALGACASEPVSDPLDDYVEVQATTVLDAPGVAAADISLEKRQQVNRGEYMVELLGCGTCHTTGALRGEPDARFAMAGSDVGIAWTTPLQNRNPGVVYPPNITPDADTGIGSWNAEQIAAAIRQGTGRHGKATSLVMPWPGYARLSDADTQAIVAYLQSLPPVRHRVPKNVGPGEIATEPFVYFGIYRSK